MVVGIGSWDGVGKVRGGGGGGEGVDQAGGKWCLCWKGTGECLLVGSR